MTHPLLIIIASLLFISCTSRQTINSNHTLPKTAPVDVTVLNEKQNVLEKLAVVFKSTRNKKEFPVYTDNSGKVFLHLPPGDTYEIYIVGSDVHNKANILEIPALKPNQYYKDAFKVDIEYEAPKTFILNDCLFEINSFTISSNSYENLNLLAEYMLKVRTQKIELGGHCNSSEVNQLELTLNRAKAVKDYLLSKGINSNRILIKSYGSTEAIGKTTDGTHDSQYRRTGIILIN